VLQPTAGVSSSPDAVACFWVFQLRPSWRLLDGMSRNEGVQESLSLIRAAQSDGLALRGAYAMTGLRADADLMLWCVGADADRIQRLGVDLRRSGLGRHLEPRQVLLGLAGPSEYTPDHQPAFVKGEPPRRFLAVYPFVKSTAWYMLPFEERREMMAEHGRAGRCHDVAASTVRAHGLGDAEFVVALEADSLRELVDCLADLRQARVREFTARDVPVYLGRLQPLESVLADLN